MPRTPVRSRTNVTAASLERLGTPKLAALLVEQARRDRTLRETLARALAEAAGPDDLRHYIERRLPVLAKARPAGDAAAARARVGELDDLRRSAVEVIAPRDLPAAISLLRLMVELAPAIVGRIEAAGEATEAWQTAVVSDLAGLWQRDAPRADEVADFVAACCESYGEKPTELVTPFAPLLGEPGLLRVQAQLQSGLTDLPTQEAGGSWGAAGGRAYDTWRRARLLRRRLGEIADLRGDVDGFIALQQGQPRSQVQVRAIVERLLRAGRSDEALTWLDDARYHNRLIDTTDLRLAALDAAGRGEAAQALRWQRFERQLDRAMLRDYLAHLPDFEDFEAERRAMEYALAARSASDALAFLTAWPDLDMAARLLRARAHEFGATPPEALFQAAEALRERHPQESVIAVRLAVLAVLQRGLSRLYEKAAQALADCATLPDPSWPPSGPESHDAFIDRLRDDYRRQWGFWRPFEAAKP